MVLKNPIFVLIHSNLGVDMEQISTVLSSVEFKRHQFFYFSRIKLTLEG
jgi:hypothetical protein